MLFPENGKSKNNVDLSKLFDLLQKNYPLAAGFAVSEIVVNVYPWSKPYTIRLSVLVIVSIICLAIQYVVKNREKALKTHALEREDRIKELKEQLAEREEEARKYETLWIKEGAIKHEIARHDQKGIAVVHGLQSYVKKWKPSDLDRETEKDLKELLRLTHEFVTDVPMLRSDQNIKIDSPNKR